MSSSDLAPTAGSRNARVAAPASATGSARASVARNAAASVATAAARAFVEANRGRARTLGVALAGHIHDPGAFVDAARRALEALADPAYLAGQRLVAPGIGPTLGVRTPLLAALLRGLRRGVRDVRPAPLLAAAAALAHADIRELRWMAIDVLAWILPEDPERAWQVLRRIGRDADDWITVDTLAATMADGILREPYRWAELEQLVFSPIRWERRLVGSAVATIPHASHARGRTAETVRRGLGLVGQLIGDAEPDVQKSLSWALRELARVDAGPVAAFCRAEAMQAAATADGYRAWVLRDALAKLPDGDAAAIRATLAGMRRVPGAPPTSRAAATAGAFAAAGLGRPLPEASLT